MKNKKNNGLNIHWRTYSAQQQTHLPQHLRSWLVENGSLTQHLIAATEQRFHVEVVSESWTRLLPDEAQRLNMPPHSYAWVRDVKLCGDGKPWIFARTIIPRASIIDKTAWLLRLGNQSLGHYLFQQPTLNRSPLEIAYISKQQLFSLGLEKNLSQVSDKLWGRRSVFSFKNSPPLLVTEYFLPDLPSYPDEQ